MNLRLLLAVAVVASVTLVATSDAEARRGWRRSRATTSYRAPRATSSYSPRSHNQQLYQAWRQTLRPSSRVTYSGISRGEQSVNDRREAWFELRTGGFRLVDFL